MTVHAEQRPCGNNVITPVHLKKLQCSTRLRTLLNFIHDDDGFTGNKR